MSVVKRSNYYFLQFLLLQPPVFFHKCEKSDHSLTRNLSTLCSGHSQKGHQVTVTTKWAPPSWGSAFPHRVNPPLEAVKNSSSWACQVWDWFLPTQPAGCIYAAWCNKSSFRVFPYQIFPLQCVRATQFSNTLGQLVCTA